MTAPKLHTCRACQATLYEDGSVCHPGATFCKRCGTSTMRIICDDCLPYVTEVYLALQKAAPRKSAADKLD